MKSLEKVDLDTLYEEYNAFHPTKDDMNKAMKIITQKCYLKGVKFIGMRKFKKAETFGQKDQWQLNREQIQEVYFDMQGTDFSVWEEEIENVIQSLVNLGYIEIGDE